MTKVRWATLRVLVKQCEHIFFGFTDHPKGMADREIRSPATYDSSQNAAAILAYFEHMPNSLTGLGDIMLPRRLTVLSTTLVLPALTSAVSALGQTVDPQTGAIYNNVAGGKINTETGGFYSSNGAIDAQTGQPYPSVAGGVLKPSTGGQGYLNPQTGQYRPSY